MMNKFLRENVWAAAFLTVIRVYLGWEWMIHGWEKLTAAKPFDAVGFLKGSIDKPVMDKATNDVIYPIYTAFIKNFALPNVQLINKMIPMGEFLVGLGLFLGCLTTIAMFFGLVMNFMFLFGGTVSINPWYILVGFIILVAGANASKFGLDYYVLPYLRKLFTPKAKEKGTIKAA